MSLNKEGRPTASIGVSDRELELIQEALRGVVRIPGGTANALDSRSFPIQVMGKTGTTNACRDALFVGSTYGEKGITVAVRVGFDDNRTLGERETGGKAALPIFREILLGSYRDGILGTAPRFPRRIEEGIDQFLASRAPVDGGEGLTTPVVAAASVGALQ
jgi:membrane carboxypeptidase/penicillin-binding protein